MSSCAVAHPIEVVVNASLQRAFKEIILLEPLDPGRQWYAVQLRPNQYQIAARNLARQHVLTFMPEILRDVRTSKGFVQRRRPLFPGYVFVSFPDATTDWYRVANTRGVSRVVTFGSRQPAPLPRQLLRDLMERTGDDGLLRPLEPLAPGQIVRVTRGPFADFIAQVERVDGDEERVWLLLELLGQYSRVGVSIDNVVREERP
jgi:transcriptional antiterminator RfaH